MRSARIDRVATIIVTGLEAITMALLAVLVLLAIAGLVAHIAGDMRPPFLAGESLNRALDDVLAVFVLIELLATASAYLRGTDVLRRLFEAVFVAISRKVITLELGSAPLEKAGAVCGLLLAAGVTWWLVSRAKQGSKRPPHEP